MMSLISVDISKMIWAGEYTMVSLFAKQTTIASILVISAYRYGSTNEIMNTMMFYLALGATAHALYITLNYARHYNKDRQEEDILIAQRFFDMCESNENFAREMIEKRKQKIKGCSSPLVLFKRPHIDRHLLNFQL